MAKGLWIVRPRNADAGVAEGVRLIRAEKRNHVEGFILQDFEIVRATPEDTHGLGSVVIEETE
jgi:hypothetical protein